MTKTKTYFAAIAFALLLGLPPQSLIAGTGNSLSTSAKNTENSVPTNLQLAKQVRNKLLRLPYYGVFDNLAYRIDGSEVTLHGQVVRSSTRSEAARSVAGISGVTRVINKIELLPLSGFDDSIRIKAYREIERTGGLYRYFMGTNPSLHIVVNRGHITLAGVVSNKMDKQLAYIAASGVPGVFSVTNDLKVEGENRAR